MGTNMKKLLLIPIACLVIGAAFMLYPHVELRDAHAVSGGPRGNLVSGAPICDSTPAQIATGNTVSVCVRNPGPDAVTIGSSGIAVGVGLTLTSGTSWCDDVKVNAVWCVKAGAGQNIEFVGSI